MKDFIKNKLRENLIKEDFQLSTGDVKKLVAIGLDSSFDDPSRVKGYLKKTIDNLNKLPQIVTLYRVVFVNKKEDINTDEIGSHYAPSRSSLEQSHQQISHVGGGNPFLLTVKADKSLIDLQTTLKNKVMYPHENEITLLNKGKGAKITRVEPFAPRDEFEDFDF